MSKASKFGAENNTYRTGSRNNQGVELVIINKLPIALNSRMKYAHSPVLSKNLSGKTAKREVERFLSTRDEASGLEVQSHYVAYNESNETSRTGSGNHQCLECNVGFEYAIGLNNHIKIVHGRPFAFSCTLCGKGVRSRRDLLGHMATWHNLEKQFICQICHKEFGYKRALSRHSIKAHGLERFDECV